MWKWNIRLPYNDLTTLENIDDSYMTPDKVISLLNLFILHIYLQLGFEI